MMISTSYALLFCLAATVAVACDLVAHGTTLRMDCAGSLSGLQSLATLGDKLTKHPDATSLALDLQFDHLFDDWAKHLSHALHKVEALTSLSLQLDGNSISDQGVRSLGAAVANLKKLKHLSLSLQYGEMGAAAFGDLGACISNLQELEQLSLLLKFNHVGSSGLGAFSRSFTRMTSLESLTLDVYSNSISDAGVVDLAASVTLLTKLKRLSMDLRYNDVSKVGSDELMAALHGMKLTELSVVLPSRSPAEPERMADQSLARARGPPTTARPLQEQASSTDEQAPTLAPATPVPTPAPTLAPATPAPTPAPTLAPATLAPTPAPTLAPATLAPTPAPTLAPATRPPLPVAATTRPLTTLSARKVATTSPAFAIVQTDSSSTMGASDAEVEGTTTEPLGTVQADSTAQGEGSSLRSTAVTMFGFILLGGLIAGALRANGIDVIPSLRNARTFFQEQALPTLRSAGASLQSSISSVQARDYSSNLDSPALDTEPPSHLEPIYQQQMSAQANFNPRGPDLAARVDAAAAKVNPGRRGPSANLSLDELMNQNLSGLQASRDQME